MNHVVLSTDASIWIQLITGAVSFQGVFASLPKEHAILVDILKMESAVQAIELFFYTMVLREMARGDGVEGMAATRYFDWVITTPTMLLTTIIYLKYEELQQKGASTEISFTDFVKTNINDIAIISACNLLMLIFGYLGEKGSISRTTSFFAGSAFFAMAFYVIYSKYARHSKEGKKLFNFLLGIWSLYGIASLLSPSSKNTSYNILDIFAKNFFGLFVYYKIKNIQKTP